MEQSDTASCPECGAEMPITAEHNGIAWVGHGICAKCGWASQHALPDDSQTQHMIVTAGNERRQMEGGEQ